MKINNFLFILGLSTITAVQTIAQEKKQAVSIVFTDQSDRATVDAVIPVGEEHLDALLKKHQLTQNDVHLIRMDMQLNWQKNRARITRKSW